MPRLTDPELAVFKRVATLLEEHRPGLTLPRPFYCDDAIFKLDLHRIFHRSWLFVSHTSHLSHAGDYMVFEFAGESLILLRGATGEIHALFNVCRHRGARICDQPSGHRSSLVCPYHQWTYGLDGALLSARNTGPDFDAREFSLSQAMVRVVEGFVFVSLSDKPPDFSKVEQDLRWHLSLHDLSNARLCHSRQYLVRANWKLIDENARECFHCPGSHPEYCRAVISAGATTAHAVEQAAQIQSQKEEYWRSVGIVVEQKPFAPGTWHSVNRYALRPGVVTESLDGNPVAPIMGQVPTRDAGVVGIGIYPNFLAEVCSDHAVTLRFIPVAADLTAVEISWLVHPDAQDHEDYDLNRLTAVWRATAEQDWKLCELNQLGVQSSRYRPGPYALSEWGCRHFVDWYLGELLRGGPSGRESCSYSVGTET
ncbi:MAG: hypothetical protein DMG69_02825 [Acidobacteria bacterium]|nr:MAG: hypothetical protein DMG69_02825 [Acidobacteriota bacterium]